MIDGKTTAMYKPYDPVNICIFKNERDCQHNFKRPFTYKVACSIHNISNIEDNGVIFTLKYKKLNFLYSVSSAEITFIAEKPQSKMINFPKEKKLLCIPSHNFSKTTSPTATSPTANFPTTISPCSKNRNVPLNYSGTGV